MKSRTSLPTLFNRPLQTADPSALPRSRSEPATHYFYATPILQKISPFIKFILLSSFPIAIGIAIGIGFDVVVFGLLNSLKKSAPICEIWCARLSLINLAT